MWMFFYTRLFWYTTTLPLALYGEFIGKIWKYWNRLAGMLEKWLMNL